MEENVFGYSNLFYSNNSKKRNKLSYNQRVVVTNPSNSSCIWEIGSKGKDAGQELMQLVVICIKFKIFLIDFTESVLTQLLCLNCLQMYNQKIMNLEKNTPC